jgi:sterol desaturase/sphingolipid hydroxylase (fatty acid hydroxylase superfamily)
VSAGWSFVTLVVLFVTVAALERIPRLQFAPSSFRRPYLTTDVAWYLVASGAAIVTTFLFGPLLSKLALPGAATTFADLPVIVRLGVAIVVYDFVATAIHAGMHRADALWSIHKVHHSSLRLDWLATTRAHMGENLVRQLPAQATLFALGVPASTIAIVLLGFASFALLGHSNLRLGGRIVELVFVTPRLHRLHHLTATSQNNFGTVLTIWDRMMGRLVSRDVSPQERFGVPGEIDTYPQRFADALRQPMKEARVRRAANRALHSARA